MLAWPHGDTQDSYPPLLVSPVLRFGTRTPAASISESERSKPGPLTEEWSEATLDFRAVYFDTETLLSSLWLYLLRTVSGCIDEKLSEGKKEGQSYCEDACKASCGWAQRHPIGYGKAAFFSNRISSAILYSLSASAICCCASYILPNR